MKSTKRFKKGIIFRILVSVFLACAAVALFILSRPVTTKPTDNSKQELASILFSIDRDVDTVLSHFMIDKKWIKKQQIPLPNANIYRSERQVAIPKEVIPVQVNFVLNNMAKKYGGRAVASENLKENTVAIHIEVQGYIVQTILLKQLKQVQSQPKKVKRFRI
jgi:hypothetical protein